MSAYVDEAHILYLVQAATAQTAYDDAKAAALAAYDRAK